MSNAIKDLNVSFSLLIDFEVKWQSSLSDKLSKKIKEFSQTIMTNKQQTQQTPINCALICPCTLNFDSLPSELYFFDNYIVPPLFRKINK